MAPRNTLNRITSRIDELAERLTPNREPITIIGTDEAACQARLEELEAAGQLAGRRVCVITTGVPSAERATVWGLDECSAADPTEGPLA
ncbi:MAG TPA: hypothetical protein VH558_02170 [Pseudolabrys sp.]